MCEIITSSTYYRKGYYLKWTTLSTKPAPAAHENHSQYNDYTKQREDWCLKNLEGKVCFASSFANFELETDMMAFKLGYE